MDHMLSEFHEMRRELESLSRKDLQALAKQEGIRANGKSADIIDMMLRLASPELFAAASSQQAPAGEDDSQQHLAGLAQAAAGSKSTATGNSPAAACSKVVQADAGSQSTKDQADVVQSRQATVPQQQPCRSLTARRSSGNGRKTWKPKPQDITAEQLQPKLQQLNMSPSKGTFGRQPEVPAGRQSQLAGQQSVLQAAPAVLGLPVGGRTSSATTAAMQQPRLHVCSDMMLCSWGAAQSSSKSSSNHAKEKRGPSSSDQVIGEHLAPSTAAATKCSAVPASKTSAAPVACRAAPKQQQGEDAPPTPGHVLHTPMRVRVNDSSSNLTAAAPAARRPGVQTAAGYPCSNIRAGAVTPPRQGAVTPPRQKVKALAGCAQAASQAGGGHAQSAIGAGRAVTPLRGAGAGVPRHSSNAEADDAAGLMSPRLAALGGSARRVVSTQARTAGVAPVRGAAACSNAVAHPASSATASAGMTLAAAGPPSTPLQKPAKRTVDDRNVDEGDKQLEKLVERCLRIVSPDAAQSVLHGPEPAKRWLQQHIVAPLKRAAPTLASAAGQAPTTGRGSNSSTCLAAGYCHRSILLYGPSGCGKTELVHALARQMGANLLYVPAGDLLRSCQDQGQKLIRALMRVARRVSPCIVCFDDAHRSFPADKRLPSQQKTLVELTVQLQQLADMQLQLQEKLQQQRCGSSSSSLEESGLGSPGKTKRPAWGLFGGKRPEQLQQQQQQQQPAAKQPLPAYASLAGPVVVVFATRHPEALDPSLLQLLHCRLLLDVPSADTREEMLLSWLMEKEAAVGVQDVEKLTRDTEGFSCNDLLQLCHEAAMRPVQERAHRAICMRDFLAAFLKVKPITSRVSPTGR